MSACLRPGDADALAIAAAPIPAYSSPSRLSTRIGRPRPRTSDMLSGIMSRKYAPRIQAFRDDIIKTLPRAPNNRASLERMRAMPTRHLILAFVTWRMRFIPAKPRAVSVWSSGVTPLQFQIAKPRLRHLLDRVEAGDDLTPFLSLRVNRKGIVLPGAGAAVQRQDIDMVLTRHGLHHFHDGTATPSNPKGRSGGLVFAEVLEDEFRIIAISDHGVFDAGSAEQLRFFEICHSYMAKDIPPGQAFMPNPVMASGHSLVVTIFADKCEDEMLRRDPLLDDHGYIDKLYSDQPILKDGQLVGRPLKPSLEWYFDDLKFGILDRATMVFFCIFPFFAR